MPKFIKGQSGNPGGRPRADPVAVDLLAELHRQLALVDLGKGCSKGAELVAALLAAGCGGDVKAIQEVLSRVHGKVQSGKPEGVDIGALIQEVTDRAARRKLELALMEKRVALAGKALEGPEDRIDLEAVARRMQDIYPDDPGPGPPPPIEPPSEPPWPAAATSAPIPPTPEPTPQSHVLPGEYFDMGGITIEVKR